MSKNFWDDKTLAALNELSRVEVPQNLAAKLKDIPNERAKLPIFALRPLAISLAVIFIIFTSIFYKHEEPRFTYANLESESDTDYSALVNTEDEDIFDDTLNDMEEILWSEEV